jgi:hypothetical protein
MNQHVKPISVRALRRDARMIRVTRESLEAAISRMIEILDALDAPAEDVEPDEDFEPSLGSAATYERVSQDFWGVGGRADVEDDSSDLEPSLASSEASLTTQVEFRDLDGRAVSFRTVFGDQTGWAWGGTGDLEGPDDNGIGDSGGLAEQMSVDCY